MLFASSVAYLLPTMPTKLEEGLAKAGVSRAQRHLFLCLGPDCHPLAEGEVVWEYVKKRVREAGISAMRTKAGCFRVCTRGPWLVVYPEGVWYSELSVERFERILQEHLLGGVPVEEWVVTRNALGCADPMS